MLKVHTDFPLKHNTSFAVDIASQWYTAPSTIDETIFAVAHAREKGWKTLIIGEGSNMLFTGDYPGLIIQPKIEGIQVLDESDSEVLLRAGAGINWDVFVEYCVNNNWYGLENLSLIPGSVGAAPVQNIGAYGQEARNIIENVEAVDTHQMVTVSLSNNSCEFGYRDSLFKHGLPGEYIVTNVVFRLSRKKSFILDYGNVKDEFSKSAQQNLKGLRNTIISIRERKLPDPRINGNAGSFFKNPVITTEKFTQLLKSYKNIPGYKLSNSKIKVPAAWLIEQAGWKGIREGDVGTWPAQPLVIVNYGRSSGKEIFEFSEKIRLAILEKFHIDLEREVKVIE